jgi:SAM-dependent methyltransferase
MAVIFLPGAGLARGETANPGEGFGPCLQTAQILDLAKYLASTSGALDSYARVAKAVFDQWQGGAIHMTAFEENPFFIYAVAEMQLPERLTPPGRPAEKIYHWVRRLIILNASTFLVDDEFLTPVAPGMNGGCLSSARAPQVSGGGAHVVEAGGEISPHILFPGNAAYQVRPVGQEAAREGYLLETSIENPSPGARLLQVLHVGSGLQTGGASKSELVTAAGDWNLTVTAGDQVFRLTLPPPAEAAGEIAITTLEGRTLVGSRPLPSGILPHGPEGNRLLEHWDSAYRRNAPAPWDIGRPADELQKFVAEGKVGRCRVVDLCCGSGTDAIYLARQGFDVTGIDVSPTALGQARQKARDANVSVHWVLADVLAPPELKPFDFLYDRACYHVVREQNLAAYLDTVRRLSHPGTSFLLLAARLDEMAMEENWGVSEDDLRLDFLKLFDLVWLRKIQMEVNQQEAGLPAWSAFMKRKAAP